MAHQPSPAASRPTPPKGGWVALALALSVMLSATIASAEEPPSIKEAAQNLNRATVTVRITYPQPEVLPAVAPREEAEAAATDRVAVCSGIFVDDSIIATHVYVTPDSRVRVTLAGGEQAEAKLVAIDEYSGAALLEVDHKSQAAPPWSDAPVEAGQWVISSAAWGAEEPVISWGVVSAAERSIRDASIPPVIECDLRSADTSSGAGVVNQKGELIGLVAATQISEQSRGWTYVVPVSHVARLLRAFEAKRPEKNILVLQRRRPTVGMVLTVDDGAVIAQRVAEGGPAAKAGLAKGDEIIAVDGVKIRSVYDVQRPVLHRQPGDQLRLVVARGEQVVELNVVLGGGVVLPPTLAMREFSQWVRPKYEVAQLADGRIVARSPTGEIRELAAGLADAETEATEEMTLPQKLALLEKALDRYQRVIGLQQVEIDRRAREQQELQSQLEALRKEVAELRKKVAP